jgi:hypothetical protein
MNFFLVLSYPSFFYTGIAADVTGEREVALMMLVVRKIAVVIVGCVWAMPALEYGQRGKVP